MSDITQLLFSHGRAALFVIVFVEQAGLPVPAAPWLLAAGALSASGQSNPALAVAVTALAAVMADSLWFYIGRRRGQSVLRLFCRLSLARNTCVARTKSLFARHGLQALVAAKFLPGLGTVMPPLAGALGMRTGLFLVFDGIGALFYGTVYILMGFLFHNQLQQVLAVLKELGFSALLSMIVLLTGYVSFKYLRRRNPLSKSIPNLTAHSRKPLRTEEEVETLAALAQESVKELQDDLSNVERPAFTLARTFAPAQRSEIETARSLAPHLM